MAGNLRFASEVSALVFAFPTATHARQLSKAEQRWHVVAERILDRPH